MLPSSWIPVIGMIFVLSSAAAQQFFLDNNPTILVTEGQRTSLTLNVVRTGSGVGNTSVVLRVEEITDNNKLNWIFPIAMVPNQLSREIPMGVIDDESDDPHRLYRFFLEQPSDGYTVADNSIVYVTFADNDGPKVFDCTKGDECKNSAPCNTNTGRCDCSAAASLTAFEDCSLIINDLIGADCGGTTCTRGGACARTGTGESRCACQPGFAGTTCLLKQRYSVKCTASGMCLNVDPPPAYQGQRYIRDHWNLTECIMRDVTPSAITSLNLPSHWEGSYICLNHIHSTCGDASSTTEADGSITRSRQVMVRQGILRIKSDIVFTGTCKYDTSGKLYLGPITVGDNDAGLNFNITNVVTPANVFVVNPETKQPVQLSTVDVGQEVCFAFLLDAGVSGYSSLRLDQVIANDTSDPASTYTVLADGCPVKGQVQVISRLPYNPTPTDPSLIYFCIEAFGFDTSSKVGFRFQLSLCTNTDTNNCSAVVCDQSQVSRGRKKRSSDEKTEYVGTTLTIRYLRPYNNEQGPVTTNQESIDCKLGWHIILAICILAALATVLLLVTLVLVIRTLRLRKHHRGDK